MTVSLAEDAVDAGTMWAREVAKEMLHAAGFGNVEVREIEDDPVLFGLTGDDIDDRLKATEQGEPRPCIGVLETAKPQASTHDHQYVPPREADESAHVLRPSATCFALTVELG